MCPVVSQLPLVPAESGCQGPRSSRKPGRDGSGVFSKHVAQQLQDLPHQGRGGVVLGDFCNEVEVSSPSEAGGLCVSHAVDPGLAAAGWRAPQGAPPFG